MRKTALLCDRCGREMIRSEMHCFHVTRIKDKARNVQCPVDRPAEMCAMCCRDALDSIAQRSDLDCLKSWAINNLAKLQS